MIIAFWSSVHGQPKTSSNMVALAITAAMNYNHRCIVTQTHFNLNNLESYLIGEKENSRDVFMNIGLDGLASVIKLRAIDKDTIENYSIQFMNNKLTLLPGTAGENKKVFINDMGKTVSILLNEMNRHYDLVFVDVNSGADEVSRLVMEMADTIVVNLCQNKNVLDHYASSRKTSNKMNWKANSLVMNKNILYLFGGYDKDSAYNLHNLRHQYRFLSKANTGMIPYNPEFMDALSSGSVIKFITRNMGAGKKNSNSYFYQCIKDATDKLMKLAGEKRGVRKY